MVDSMRMDRTFDAGQVALRPGASMARRIISCCLASSLNKAERPRAELNMFKIASDAQH